MKIRCEGCDARYSIADEKVRGRAFKIRCKRCGAALVVRADAAPASSAEGVWHVLVGDTQRGPLTVDAVHALLAAGEIGADAYAWREGLEGWQPIAELDELAPAPDPVMNAANDATTNHAPRSCAEENDRSTLQVSSAAPLTATRHESSVLFSLSNLRELSVPATRAGTATGDGSGLIDIRALATAASAPPLREERADDLLAIGSTAPLSMPVLIPMPKKESSRSVAVVAIGAATAVIAAAAAIVVVVLAGQSSTAALSTSVPTAPGHETPREIEEAAPAQVFAASEEVAAPNAPAPPSHEDAPQPEPRTAPARAHRRAPEARVEREAVAHEEHASDDPDPTLRALIDDATRGEDAPRPVQHVVAEGPPTPSRAEVTSALNGVADAVRACGNGTHGMAPVRVTFSGETGRVESAEVIGGTLAPEVRSCVARAARNAHVSRFRRATFRVDYPFRL